MKDRKIFLFLIFSFISIFNLHGVSFSGITLSSDDRLLFKTEFEGQNALFISRLADLSIQQLTAFPEKMYLVNNGRTILALNRLGAARIPVSGGLPAPLPGYPSFAEGSVPLKGRLQDLAGSADGRWILYLEPVSPGYGNLFLADTSSGAKRLVSARIELPASDFPARWSPDSRLFVYSKGGRLFYFPIISDLSALIDERFRIIGPGEISSVLWGQNGNFYYFTGNTLYRVINPELFTRTIYGDFLSIGNVAAVLPLNFDSGFDRYWIAPDSGSIIINKGGKGVFFFLLGENRNNSAILPHILIPGEAENFNVLWPSSGASGTSAVTVIFSLRREITAWRFEISGSSIRTSSQRNNPSSSKGALSPDGTTAVFWGDGGLELWDYANWRLIQRLTSEPVFSCAWASGRQIIFGNSSFIEEISISGTNYQRRRICLSGAEEFGFEESARGSSRVLAKMGNDWFASDGRTPWIPAASPQLRQTALASERYRVFLEPQSSGHYKNIPMIRNMRSTGTVSLVSRHTTPNNAFTLGRQSQIALCFDLYDDDTGLPQVLAALRRCNARATFFLNGDFIRRNPLSAAAIIEAGHETASLFYAPIDLSDSRYRVTGEFITQGLARNEDEFYRATGRELSILWHPPFYRSSGLVNTAAAAAGYITISRNIDPGDWLSRDDALRLNLRQIPASEMIDQIIAGKRTGAVIPVRLGLLPGGRDEYLFQRIDVLLDALIRSGCEIIPVSAVER
jgi:peptidoglycan/xylan/chitin deacetylase (PgdA/CDA1 family)